MPKIPFEDWLNMTADEKERLSTSDNELQRPVDFVASRYPTTTTSTTTTTPTTTAAAATTTPIKPAAAAAYGKVDVLGGELGKNVVFLSDDQIGDLLDKMDVPAFDHYVDKLSNFIIKNDAHVKNHYETILRWWQEDGAVRNPE